MVHSACLQHRNSGSLYPPAKHRVWFALIPCNPPFVAHTKKMQFPHHDFHTSCVHYARYGSRGSNAFIRSIGSPHILAISLRWFAVYLCTAWCLAHSLRLHFRPSDSSQSYAIPSLWLTQYVCIFLMTGSHPIHAILHRRLTPSLCSTNNLIRTPITQPILNRSYCSSAFPFLWFTPTPCNSVLLIHATLVQYPTCWFTQVKRSTRFLVHTTCMHPPS
jgi:hypothetical protein